MALTTLLILMALPGRLLACPVDLMLVAGIRNEGAMNPFSGWEQKISQEFGVGQIQLVRPSSTNSVEKNASLLRAIVDQQHERNQNPVIMVGHSKGAAESLAMALQNIEDLRSGKIAHLVLVNSALGTVSADLATQVCESSWVKALLKAPVTSAVAHFMFEDCSDVYRYREGVASLTLSAIQKVIHDRIRALSAEDRALLSSRITFVTSELALSQIRFPYFIRESALAVRLKGEKTDGAVELARQTVPGLGEVLGPFISNHDAPTQPRDQFARLANSYTINFIRSKVQDVASNTAFCGAGRKPRPNPWTARVQVQLPQGRTN